MEGGGADEAALVAVRAIVVPCILATTSIICADLLPGVAHTLDKINWKYSVRFLMDRNILFAILANVC